jgi:hypothetical protein
MPVHPGVGAVGIGLGLALTKTAAGSSTAVFLQSAPAPAVNGGTMAIPSPSAANTLRKSLKQPSGTYENVTAKTCRLRPLTGKAGWQTEPIAVTDINKLLVPTNGRGDTLLAGSSDGLKLINTKSGESRSVSTRTCFFAQRPRNTPSQPTRRSRRLLRTTKEPVEARC